MHKLIMGKCCLRASSFSFDRIIIKVAGNQDRHKSSDEFDFGPNQTTHFAVTCPWVKKISKFWIWISLKPVGQTWSNFMCSITGVEKRLYKVWGQFGSKLWFLEFRIWFPKLGRVRLRASSFHGPFICFLKWDLTLAHWTQVSDHCSLGCLFTRYIKLMLIF